MKVAALQLSSQADVAQNLARVSELSRQAKDQGAEWICLPEGFAFLGEETERARVAEVVGEGEISRRLAGLCHELGVYLLAGGMAEKAADASRPYNVSVLFSPDGQVVDSYRKLHLFDVELEDGTILKESRGSSPGQEVVVADVMGMQVGLSICYDVRFPLLYQQHRDRGASILTVPAAFTRSTGRAHWHVLLRARAIETQCYVIAPAQWGEHPRGRQTFGHSLIISPWGDILAELAAGDGVLLADIDQAAVESIRRQMPVWQHRRLS